MSERDELLAALEGLLSIPFCQQSLYLLDRGQDDPNLPTNSAILEARDAINKAHKCPPYVAPRALPRNGGTRLTA